MDFFLLDLFSTVLDDVFRFVLLMNVGERWKTDCVGGASVRAGHATHLAVQGIRNYGVISLVIKLEDISAAAEDA